MADQASSEATPPETVTTPPEAVTTPPETVTTPPGLSEVELDQQALLLKLEQQNRLLEQDLHFTTTSSPRTSCSSLATPTKVATPPLQEHSDTSTPPTLHDQHKSHDQLPLASPPPSDATPTSPPQAESKEKPSESQETPTTPPKAQSPIPTQSPKATSLEPDEATPTDVSSTTPTGVPSSEATPSPASDPPSSSPPSPEAPSRDLESPLEVRTKPPDSAYSSNPPTIPLSEGEESEEGGLGPEVSVILPDQQDTRIPYEVVREMEALPADVEGEGEREEEESKLRPERQVSYPSDAGHHEMEQPGHVTNVTTDTVVADPALSEERDMLSDLPSTGGSTTPQLGKGRRSRSETESKSSKVSLIPFKGRKRSQTLHEGGGAKEKDESEEGAEVSSEETRWQQWSEILKNWEEVSPKNGKLVKQLVRQGGIPEHLRGMAWQLLSDSINTELKEQYPILITEMSPHERAIRRDLNRTFPEHSFFKERDGLGQESLFNVLKAYSVYDKEVGYCQGTPFMAGLLLMQMPEEEAFCVLVQLMTSYKMRELYKPSMADLSLCFYQLDKLLEEMLPSLSMHFKAVGFQPSMYASSWFLTLFASVLSLDVSFRVLDLLLVEGREIIFKVGMALLETFQDNLLQMDMEDMIKHFQKGMKNVPEVEADSLISRALKIKLNPKKMKKFGKEYLDKKARKALEISELGRLQTENMEMNLKLNKLQQEFDSLRDQLINGQVIRAEQAEEIVQLRNDLAITRRKLHKLELEGGEEREQKEGGVAAVPEWAETNGHTPGGVRQEPHALKRHSVSREHSRDREIRPSSLIQEGEKDSVSNHTFDIYKDCSLSPQESPSVLRGMLDKGSKENLFLEDSTPDTSPALGVAVWGGEGGGEKKKKKKKLLGRSKSDGKRKKSCDQDQESTGSPQPTSPPESRASGHKSEKKKKKDKQLVMQEELERELAVCKTTCADFANQLEMKVLELKQLLQRESFLIRELKEAQQYVTKLEAKVSGEACPHCHMTKAGGGSVPSSQETTPPSSTTPPTDTGPNSSQALLTNLRAIWRSSPQSNKKDLT